MRLATEAISSSTSFEVNLRSANGGRASGSASSGRPRSGLGALNFCARHAVLIMAATTASMAATMYLHLCSDALDEHRTPPFARRLSSGAAIWTNLPAAAAGCPSRQSTDGGLSERHMHDDGHHNGAEPKCDVALLFF